MNEKTYMAQAEIEADFVFCCYDDSMINARIFAGDLVYIHQQDTAENGDIVTFLYQGEARIGIFSSGHNYIAFTPANTQYRSLVFFSEEKESVKIIGKAVAFLSSIHGQKEAG